MKFTWSIIRFVVIILLTVWFETVCEVEISSGSKLIMVLLGAHGVIAASE